MILTSLNSEEILYFSLGVIISITLSGAAQGVAAAAFSNNPHDSDTKPDLNPLTHIDFLGLLSFYVAGFGWPKSHKLDSTKINNPRLAHLVVGILLILTNLFVAVTISTVSDILGSSRVFTVVMFVCATAFAYNLLPIPPLGGFHILYALLPENSWKLCSKLIKIGPIILIVMAVLIRFGYLPVISDSMQAIVNLIEKYIFSVS